MLQKKKKIFNKILEFCHHHKLEIIAFDKKISFANYLYIFSSVYNNNNNNTYIE